MSQKPENTFRASVHRYLPETVQHDKMNNPYSSGVADDLYCGNRADLWIEYKFLPKIPVRAEVDPSKLLSSLQALWINEKYKRIVGSRERQIAVVVGCPDGGVVFADQSWMHAISAKAFREKLVSRRELAQWIVQLTTR